MNRILYTLAAVTCGLAASAQIKSTTPKVPQNGFFPAPGGTTTGLLVVGGSDDCSTAAATNAIAGPGSYAVTTVGATNGAPDAAGCVNTNLDVWFYYTCTTTGITSVTLCGGSTADTVITAWNDGSPAGTCPTTSVACNDDSTCGLQSTVTFCAVAGQSYFLQLGAFGGATTYAGTFTVTETPIVEVGNDGCGTPQAIAGPGPHPYNIAGATTGCQGQAEAICLFFGTTNIRQDVWYTWTPTLTGTATLTLCGGYTGVNSTTDSKVAIYNGAGCPSAAAIACIDDDNTCVATPLTTTITWNTVCGQTYTIQLGTFSATGTATMSGTFTIAEVGTSCQPGTEYCGEGDVNRTTACPCGNAGATGNGCASSFNPNGAHITATGTVAADDVVLQGSGMNATGNCIFLKGDVNTAAGVVFGDGVRCTDGVLIRLRAKPLVGGTSSFPDSVETVTLSQRGGTPVGSGFYASYTVYYRNAAAAFCPPETFNAANGYSIVW